MYELDLYQHMKELKMIRKMGFIVTKVGYFIVDIGYKMRWYSLRNRMFY